MDILLRSLGYNNFEIINEVTSKVVLNNTTYICKLIPFLNILPYLEIQNQGGSIHIPRIYDMKHLYFGELNDKLSKILSSDRKSYYSKDISLYLVQFEYIKGVPYWSDKYRNQQISTFNLNKLMFETFTCIDSIHNSGYYHGDLGMGSNIILEGTFDIWNRAVIVDVEGGKITDKKQIDNDIETLAYMIWQIIVDDISLVEDCDDNIITPKHPMFIDLVKDNIKRFDKYIEYLEILLLIFETKPTTTEIIDKINNI